MADGPKGDGARNRTAHADEQTLRAIDDDRQDTAADPPSARASTSNGRAPESPRLQRGVVLAGRFEIHDYLGVGGSGTVYSARDHLIGESVAIKLLHDHLRTDAAQVRRLRGEVRTARRIAHPNVCRVHDLCDTAGLVFVVMERVPGHNLRARLERPLALVPALDIARQLAAGLGAAHRAGVIHCDVKPENAILDGDRVVLTDFGVARLTGRARTSASPAAGGESTTSVEGTPAYMAPEQILERDVDERTDVYGLAAVIYELLFGRPPFGFRAECSSVVELLDRILHREPEFPEHLPGELTKEARAGVIDALKRGLAKDPAERPETVEALIAFVLAAVRLGGGGVHLPPDTALRAAQALTPAPMLTTIDGATTRNAATPTGTTTPADANQLAGRFRGTRRIATVVQVRIDDLIDEDTEEEEVVADRIEALLGAAEITLTDAGGLVVGRAPRNLVAVFGAIGSRGDEPKRAADASRAIASAACRAEAIGVRIGLDTGRLLVRKGRRGMGPTVSGRALQEAERIAAAAANCTVVASRRTARHLAQGFRLEPIDNDCVAITGRRPAAELARGEMRPLLGRDAETETAVRQLAAITTTGEPRAVLLHGVAGIGKSRLAREVLDILVARGGITVARAHARPSDAFASHAVVRALLTRLLGVPHDLGPAEVRAEVRRILGGRAEQHGNAEVDALAALLCGGGEASMPAIAAARATLVTLARRRPLLLLIDDAQWADEATLDLIEAVARGEDRAPIGLLVSTRPELLERRPNLADAFEVAVELGPLGREPAEAMAAQLLPDADPARRAAIAVAADGNPFFLEELAQTASVEADVSLPSTVEATVQARLDRLADDDRDVLRTAALLGREFRADDLVALAATALPGVDVDGVLGRLEAQRIVFPLPPDDQADDRYVIKHTLLRDVAYDELPPAQRRDLHGTAVGLLRARMGGDKGSPRELAELARHLEGANEMQQAAAAYRRAGDLSAAQADVGDAYACYAKAYELRGADADIDLLISFGEVAVDCGAPDAAKDALERAIARTEHDPRLATDAARALGTLSGVHRYKSEWEESIACARRGLALVDEDRFPTIAARLMGRIAWVRGYILGHNEEALPLARRAIELLENTPHLEELARAYSCLGACDMTAGLWEEQLHCNQRHLAIAEQLGSLPQQATAHLNLGENLRSMGDLEQAVAHSAKARDIYVRMSSTLQIGLARNNVAMSLVEMGDLARAETEAADAIRISTLSGGSYYHIEALCSLARVRARQGRFDEALEHARAALDSHVTGGGALQEGMVRRIIGAILSLAGDHAGAEGEFARAEQLLADGDAGEVARLLADRARARARRGDEERAAELREQARAALEAIGAAHQLRMLDDLNYC